MSNLSDKSLALWDAVQTKVTDAMEKGSTLHGVKQFFPQKRGRAAKLPSPSLVTLERRTTVEQWGAHRGVGSLEVTFGLTATSYKPEQSGPELESYAYALIDLFLADFRIAGLAYDTEVASVDADASPEGVEDNTQPWVTVTLIWKFEFLR